MSRSLFVAALLPLALLGLLARPAAAIVAPALDEAGLSVMRVFASPANDDALGFSLHSPGTTLVTKAVFGASESFGLIPKTADTTPQLFGRMLGSYSPYDQPGLRTDVNAAVAGVHFHLFGGEQTLTLQNVGANFNAAPSDQGAGVAPALFAFYNFSQLPQLSDNAPTFNAAPAAPAPSSGLQSLGSMSFPSIGALQPQQANAFNGLVPNTRSAAVEFRFPLVFSGMKGNLHVNGQSLRDIQPDSLATQIFGPAFATSFGRKYNSLGAGVTLALPLFDRKATVSLDGLYESLKRNDKSSFLYAANASYLANNPNALPYNTAAGTSLNVISMPSALIFYPNFIDIQHFASGASLAVPVGKALTVNGGFSEQRYNGEALNTLTQDLSLGSRSISGGLVYNIPKSNSSIDLMFNRYQYFDDVVPASNHTENRQNIYFSVKF